MRPAAQNRARPIPAADRPGSYPERNKLLGWYDRHRRRLPWRALPGEKPDAYRVWLSEVMLQQTTVATVGPYFHRFLERFPTVQALAEAPLDAVLLLWAGLGYYSRARNLHACAIAVVERHGGRFPDTVDGLLELPGIGRYTARAIASIAFDAPVVPMDGNVERVVSRLFAVREALPAAKPALERLADGFADAHRPGDFAQALMDLGATICTPRRPACALCPWREDCAATALGEQEVFPVKAVKAERPQRFATAFVATRPDGSVLLRRRPPKGLLGGMTEVPTGDWLATRNEAEPPLAAHWRPAGTVRHVFTHFALSVDVFAGRVGARTAAPDGAYWCSVAGLQDEALPTLFRKILEAGLGIDPKDMR